MKMKGFELQNAARPNLRGGSLALVGLVLLVLVLALSSTASALPSFIYSYSIPTPAWQGQGLASDGTNLFWLDTENNLIKTFNPDTGSIINSFSAPISTVGLGLAHDGTNLFLVDSSYVNTWGRIYKLNPNTGTVIGSFEIYGAIIGTAFLGNSLYVYNKGNYTLEELNPSTGAVINTYSSSIALPGLTAYGTSLIATDGSGNGYWINPASGATLSTFPLSTLSFTQGIRGLASDGTRLFSSGITGFGSGTSYIDVYVPVVIPAPGALFLGGAGVVFVGWLRRRRNL